MAKKQVIRLTESELRKVIKESVKNVLKEAKPSDRTVGKHTLKGLRYDKNGNPLYTSDTMSDDEKKNQGWRFSKKHGLYGQLSDPTKLTESDLRKVVKETVNRILKEGNESVITIGSSEYGEQGFRVELSDGGLSVKQFNVYAYNEQDALDAAVDYAEQKGWEFLFWDGDESAEEYPDDFITAGNHGHQLRSDSFIVRPL